MKYILILLFVIPSFHYAQENVGIVEGFIIDSKTEEPIPFANVSLLQANEQIIGTTTDFDGKYVLKPVKAGEYDIQVYSMGYPSKKITGIKVRPKKVTRQNISISQGIKLSNVCVTICCPSILQKDNTTIERVFKREEIQHMPF